MVLAWSRPNHLAHGPDLLVIQKSSHEDVTERLPWLHHLIYLMQLVIGIEAQLSNSFFALKFDDMNYIMYFEYILIKHT